MGDTKDLNTWFAQNYDHEMQRLEIGTCNCEGDNTAFVETDKLDFHRKLVIVCNNTTHKLWNDIDPAQELYALASSNRNRKPPMYAVKDAIAAWMKIIGNTLNAEGAQTASKDIVAVVRTIPHQDNDVSRAMNELDGNEGNAMVLYQGVGSVVGPSQDTEEDEDGVEEIRRGVAGLESRQSLTMAKRSFLDKNQRECGEDEDGSPVVDADNMGLGRPENFWFVINPDAESFNQVTAAGFVHLGTVALRHGLPFGISLVSLYRAWQMGDALQFARALEPLALQFWPETLLRRHALSALVGSALKQALNADTALQQLKTLQEMIPDAFGQGLPPPNPSSELSRYQLDKAARRRKKLTEKDSRSNERC